jgi:hypothetical protein
MKIAPSIYTDWINIHPKLNFASFLIEFRSTINGRYLYCPNNHYIIQATNNILPPLALRFLVKDSIYQSRPTTAEVVFVNSLFWWRNGTIYKQFRFSDIIRQYDKIIIWSFNIPKIDINFIKNNCLQLFSGSISNIRYNRLQLTIEA